jgi:uncharacterized protein YxjI
VSAHPVLAGNTFLVKEHVGMFKAANNYDIYDPATGQIVMECREPNLGFLTKLLRFTDYKRFTPFDIEVRTATGQLVVGVSRGIAILRSTVEAKGPQGQPLGTFRQRLMSLGGRFDVLDTTGTAVCTLQGKWTSWEFRFMAGEQELARVTKKWAGLGKELFTTADTYALEIAPAVPADSALRPLILAAVMCIDMVLKE